MSDLNPLKAENLFNPAQFYGTLRNEQPVYWSEEVRAWFVTRYDDVIACYRDSRLSAKRTDAFAQQLQGVAGPEVVEDFSSVSRRQMLYKDGVEHLRLRRVTSVFTPQVLDGWRPLIRKAMDELLERVLPLQRADFVTEISLRFPVYVMAGLFGIPAGDRERLVKWTGPLAAFSSPTPGADLLALAKQANTAQAELRDYLNGLVEQRRKSIGQDILSQMIHTHDEGEVSQEDLVANASLILTAGHLNTTDQLGNGLVDLLTHPEQLRQLRNDPSLVKSAVEEMTRFNPSVPFMLRVAAQDVPLRGQTLRKGDRVFLGMAAANRDPAVFPNPDRFDITRDHLHQKHVSFGYGVHACLGAGVGRRELEIAFEALLERMPYLLLDESQPPRRKAPALLYSGYESIALQW
ncbi:cytochrome P450 [Archangium sp.]|jgi:cytochrome P450|uniref:cytochrome P450 n=1 Tax=Archangium sp. TaxID=1872627 RepID=UPI0038998428